MTDTETMDTLRDIDTMIDMDIWISARIRLTLLIAIQSVDGSYDYQKKQGSPTRQGIVKRGTPTRRGTGKTWFPDASGYRES